MVGVSLTDIYMVLFLSIFEQTSFKHGIESALPFLFCA